MGGVVRESFKFRGRPQSLNQSPAHQPGRRAANSIFAAHRFGLARRRRGAAIRKPNMQRCEVYTRLTRVPIDHRRILEILAKGKVRGKDLLVQPRERGWLMPPGTFS
jgi:hypothetical protein